MAGYIVTGFKDRYRRRTFPEPHPLWIKADPNYLDQVETDLTSSRIKIKRRKMLSELNFLPNTLC